MGRSSKRKKVDGIQFNIGKRIKVQAQRKFAQGAAVLPGQALKDSTTVAAPAASSAPTATTSTSAPTDAELTVNQTKRTEGKPKVYTEDFLTYLCFKGSPSLPPHIRTGSFLRPQSISPSPSNSVANNQSTSQSSQTIPQVQGFIPFGVRKRASQYPKRAMRKHSMMKGKFNKRKPVSDPKTSGTNRKMFTRASIAKTITKKKEIKSTNNTPTYSIATRRQSYKQKPIRKTIPVKAKVLQLRKGVALRNRVVSLTAQKTPEKLKTQGIIKKKVIKPIVKGQGPKAEVPKQIIKKDTPPKEVPKAPKNLVTTDVVNTPNVNTITTRKKSGMMKTTESQPVCVTRSATTKQLSENTPLKVKVKHETKPVVEQQAAKPEVVIEKFDFSSDDDEPLYKKISTQKNQSNKQSPDQHRLTRSTIKDATDNPGEVVEKTPIKVCRVMPQKITKEKSPSETKEKSPVESKEKSSVESKEKSPVESKEKSPTAPTPQTRSKSIRKNVHNLRNSKTESPKKVFNTIEKKVIQSTGKNIKPAKKQVTSKIPKKSIPTSPTDEPMDTAEKVDSDELMKSSKMDDSKSSEQKMEKSFSESDDEPLATKVTDTTRSSDKVTTRRSAKGKTIVDNNSSSSETPIGSNTNIGLKKLVIDENSKSISSVVSDTNPIPSQEESLKIFGIAHRKTAAAEAAAAAAAASTANTATITPTTTPTKTGNKGKAVKPRKKVLKPKDPVIVNRRRTFRGNFETSANLQKYDLKNRQSRKFMKSKEYIEQWLKNSARTFTNRSAMSASTSTTSLDKTTNPSEPMDFENDVDDNSQNRNDALNPPQAKPEEKNVKSAAASAKVTTPNKTDERSETSSKKITLPTEESSNIYEFESDSEIIASPPRKFKDSQKKIDKNQSVFGTNKKVVSNFSFGENLQDDGLNTSKENSISEIPGHVISTNKSVLLDISKILRDFFGNLDVDIYSPQKQYDHNNFSLSLVNSEIMYSACVTPKSIKINITNHDVDFFDYQLQFLPNVIKDILQQIYLGQGETDIFGYFKMNNDFFFEFSLFLHSFRNGSLFVIYNINWKRSVDSSLITLEDYHQSQLNFLSPNSDLFLMPSTEEFVPDFDFNIPSVTSLIEEQQTYPEFESLETNYYPDVRYDHFNVLPSAEMMVYDSQPSSSSYSQYYPQQMETSSDIQENYLEHSDPVNSYSNTAPSAFNEQLFANYSDNFNTNKHMHNPNLQSGNLNYTQGYDPQYYVIPEMSYTQANVDNSDNDTNYDTPFSPAEESRVEYPENLNFSNDWNHNDDQNLIEQMMFSLQNTIELNIESNFVNFDNIENMTEMELRLTIKYKYHKYYRQVKSLNGRISLVVIPMPLRAPPIPMPSSSPLPMPSPVSLPYRSTSSPIPEPLPEPMPEPIPEPMPEFIPEPILMPQSPPLPTLMDCDPQSKDFSLHPSVIFDGNSVIRSSNSIPYTSNPIVCPIPYSGNCGSYNGNSFPYNGNHIGGNSSPVAWNMNPVSRSSNGINSSGSAFTLNRNALTYGANAIPCNGQGMACKNNPMGCNGNSIGCSGNSIGYNGNPNSCHCNKGSCNYHHIPPNYGSVACSSNSMVYNGNPMVYNQQTYLPEQVSTISNYGYVNPASSTVTSETQNYESPSYSEYLVQPNRYDPLLSNGYVQSITDNNSNYLTNQEQNYQQNYYNYNPNTNSNSGSTNIYFAETETIVKNPIAVYPNSLYQNYKQPNTQMPQKMFNNYPGPLDKPVMPSGIETNVIKFGGTNNLPNQLPKPIPVMQQNSSFSPSFNDMNDFDVNRQGMSTNPIYGNLVINKNSKIPVVHIKPTMAESINPIQPPAFNNRNEYNDYNPTTTPREITNFNDFLMQESNFSCNTLNPLASLSVPAVNIENTSGINHEEFQRALNDVNNGNQAPKPNEIEDHLFYIPLTGVKKNNDKCNHFIEGVAVQMESDGPDGLQQRVMMRAKLIKKSQLNKNANNAKKNTDLMQDMVRSVREAFPEATIHSETGIVADDPWNVTQNSANQINGASSSSGAVPQPQRAGRAPDRFETIRHRNNTTFPQVEDPAQVVEAPVFQPTEKEFQDPLEFIEKISPVAARYGLCKIIPPPSFKSECKISDDMRFTPHNQYLHRMMNRWGPSSREMCAIKKYLATQSVTFKQPPILSGIEVDLPKLYHIVQNMGGLNKVLEKKMWHKIAEEMCLPQNVHYMDIRLDEIYCKYLLPYDTLSPDERKRLFESVDNEWEKRQQRMMDRAANPLNLLSGVDADEPEHDMTEDIEECITRGKSTTLCSYARTAKNTMTMQFGKVQQPTPDEVESKFWDYVTTRDSHVCVSTGSIDSSVWGYGFPNAKNKNSPIAKHPWNLKVLTNNSGSVLRSLTPIMGVNVPTIHVGMIFSTCCWYRDPHGLPWIEYLHDGAPKIWYGVPDSQSAKFKETLTSVVPSYCQKKTIWLLSDTTMVPPTMLTDHGVSLCRTIQNPGEFILVFPKAFTSSICAGYNVSESVYFALNSWLDTAQQDFVDIRNSCEPSMFSLERLIVSISEDVRTPYHVLKKVLPALDKIIQTEKQHREVLFNLGLKVSERTQNVLMRKKVVKRQDEIEECHRCRSSLSLSMLYNDSDGSVFCLLHGAEFLSANKSQIDKSKLVYTNSIDELERLQSKLIERLNTLANKKCGKTK